MSDRVYKYTLHDHGVAIVPLPSGAEVLHVADQCGAIQLWARVDPEAKPLVGRRFATLYTGFDEVLDEAVYLGTVIRDVLGHASIKTTEKHYAHAIVARQRAALEKLGALADKATGT